MPSCPKITKEPRILMDYVPSQVEQGNGRAFQCNRTDLKALSRWKVLRQFTMRPFWVQSKSNWQSHVVHPPKEWISIRRSDGTGIRIHNIYIYKYMYKLGWCDELWYIRGLWRRFVDHMDRISRVPRSNLWIFQNSQGDMRCIWRTTLHKRDSARLCRLTMECIF